MKDGAFALVCCHVLFLCWNHMKMFVSTGEAQIHPAAGEYHGKEAGARLVESPH